MNTTEISIVQMPDRHSPYVLFSRSADSTLPSLCFLRVELNRARPGMSDFLIRISTPRESGTVSVVTVRAGREFTSPEVVKQLCVELCKEMEKLGNKAHTWDSADVDHMAKMLEAPIRLFVKTPAIEVVGFSTDALR